MSYVKSTVSEVLPLCERKLQQIVKARECQWDELRLRINAKRERRARRWFLPLKPLTMEQVKEYVYQSLYAIPDLFYTDEETRTQELLAMCRTGSQEVLLSAEDAAMLKS